MVTKPCDQCEDDPGHLCWLCSGATRVPATAYDLELIRRSVAEKGLVPAGYVIQHQGAS